MILATISIAGEVPKTPVAQTAAYKSVAGDFWNLEPNVPAKKE